jgi:hypothetical protein
MSLVKGLTLSGKKRGKVKFASAEAKRQYEQLQKDWAELKTKWGVTDTSKRKTTVVELPTIAKSQIRDSANGKPKSLNSWVVGAVSSKQTQHYTGSQVIGVTIVHKSCLQPVFNQQEAIDAANMRR